MIKFLTILIHQTEVNTPGPFLMLSLWLKRQFNLKRGLRYLQFSEKNLPHLNFLRQNQFKNRFWVVFFFFFQNNYVLKNVLVYVWWFSL